MLISFRGREGGGGREKKERRIVRDENWKWNAINSSGMEWNGVALSARGGGGGRRAKE